ncbi:unnamed protein product [Enterobius vermicularis]|uniref:TsaA-like domain-containing protein n=1 Tax=Enterobius vermicularis TaxID=51028 RepID=A0A0N4VFF6_ENTVE|nr:unnamed protein product [Enterobius vermicularis]
MEEVKLKCLPSDDDAKQLGITPRIIGWVRSPLKRLEDCPHWQDSGPEAIIEIKSEYAPALVGVTVGQKILLITWLHKSDRTFLQGCRNKVHWKQPRGVFNSRSPARPNPIGLHEVTVLDIQTKDCQPELRVNALEALDGTPVLDIKRADR